MLDRESNIIHGELVRLGLPILQVEFILSESKFCGRFLCADIKNDVAYITDQLSAAGYTDIEVRISPQADFEYETRIYFSYEKNKYDELELLSMRSN